LQSESGGVIVYKNGSVLFESFKDVTRLLKSMPDIKPCAYPFTRRITILDQEKICCNFAVTCNAVRLWFETAAVLVGCSRTDQGCQIGFFDAKFHKFGFF